jgi:hypothetical protein
LIHTPKPLDTDDVQVVPRNLLSHLCPKFTFHWQLTFEGTSNMSNSTHLKLQKFDFFSFVQVIHVHAHKKDSQSNPQLLPAPNRLLSVTVLDPCIGSFP